MNDKIVSRSFPRLLTDALLDVFFPRECLIFGGDIGNSPYRFLSPNGRNALTLLDANYCPSCGAPRAGIVTVHGECVFCRGKKFYFRRSRSLVVFDTSATRLVHAIKYRAVHAALADLAKIASESEVFSMHLRDATLVPVPLFLKRENMRGYNQSLIFAKELARRIPGAKVKNLLVRTRDTGTQTRLSAISRKLNVRNAFCVPEKHKKQVTPTERYVVIDDVFTTGSTLSECARALKMAGAKLVDAATFAHG